MYQNLALLTVFVFLYSLVSGGLRRTPLSGAIVFVAFGLAFGPLGLKFLDLSIDAEGLRSLAELTLALVLFTDAANANLGVLSRNLRLPERLLLGGLPLTILLGFGVGVALFGNLSLLEAAILATMLAPTDAALGKAVVTDPSVPPDVREGLNVESGLNDGICVPILLLILDLATRKAGAVEGGSWTHALMLFAEQIGIGAAVGIALALVGAGLLKWCAERGWVTESWRQLPVVALAVGCFALGQICGGSGFIASFAGGLLFGLLAKQH
ncbi:MAG: cation:proton antiporter domain-containing protein, partial [Burkholderiales bacterium]